MPHIDIRLKPIDYGYLKDAIESLAQDSCHKSNCGTICLCRSCAARQVLPLLTVRPDTLPLRLCLKEIEQFHSTAYPDCKGGCPGHEAMDAAKAELESDADRSYRIA